MLKISQAKLHDSENIKAFYKQCGYGGDLSEEAVIAPFQRQGVGTQLLQACTEQLAEQVSYCIPWQHLKSFYQEVGFQEVSPLEVPDLLRQRFNSYTSRRMNVILMRRLPTA
jgi:N-acetylglutamate synthase-like GNAT family acetyltransferase